MQRYPNSLHLILFLETKISLIQMEEESDIFWNRETVQQSSHGVCKRQFDLNQNILSSIIVLLLYFEFLISHHYINSTHCSAICLLPLKMPTAEGWAYWQHPAKAFSWNLRSLDISSYLGFDSSVKPSGSQRSRKSEACNYGNRLGLPWGKCDSFAVCYNWVTY